MSATTRPTPDVFANASWPDILPLYDALAERPLDPSNADAWLADWSALDEALEEAGQLAMIAYGADTTDPAKETAYLRFAGEIGPRMDEQRVRLAGRLLETGYTRADMETVLRRFRNQRDLFRAENVPLQQREEELKARYQKLTGGMTAPWEGKDLPLPRLAPFLLDPQRDVRERAYRLQAAPYIEQRDALADLFDAQYALREQTARNAGFANYRDYAHQSRNRFDYTPADCRTFHDAVAEAVVPVVARRSERRRRQLGVDSLRPWDTEPDPLGRPPLRPFGTVEELGERSEAIFARVDPPLGDYFGIMRREGLLDLESRKGKAPGGYCTALPYRRRPFIFMNAAGVARDVRTLLHEGGHAFHGFEAQVQPYLFQWHPGAEMAEVASMAMELLSLPYLARSEGGFYDDAEARRAHVEQLERTLDSLPWIATVDAFQHWLYTSGEGHDRDARDAAWVQIYSRFDPGIDWTGLEAERVARWYRQLHIFLYPFYYIEYGIAQLGALQVWRHSLRDQAGAVAAYRRALALGGTRPLPELFAAAGARLAFDAGTVAELVGLIEEQLAQLDG